MVLRVPFFFATYIVAEKGESAGATVNSSTTLLFNVFRKLVRASARCHLVVPDRDICEWSLLQQCAPFLFTRLWSKFR